MLNLAVIIHANLLKWLDGLSQDDVATCFDFYADLAEKLDGRQWEQVELGEEDFESEVRREPLGVVALVTPWNYPLLMGTVRTLRHCRHTLHGSRCLLPVLKLHSLIDVVVKAFLSHRISCSEAVNCAAFEHRVCKHRRHCCAVCSGR